MESIWFTWITSLSHFPMVIKTDGKENWVVTQLQSSQNFTSGTFEDWFSGIAYWLPKLSVTFFHELY